MVKWSDQKDFGTKEGSLGMKKGTTGRFMNYEDFSKQASRNPIQVRLEKLILPP
jgi:hypothetical protein